MIDMRTVAQVSAVVAAFVIIEVLGAQPAFAQGMKWRGSGGWGPGGQYMGMYDPKSVETVKGEVVSVDFVTPMKGMTRGVHLVLKTEKESIPVQARVTLAGKPAIIAAEVKKGDAVLTLRDASGFPAWSAMRRR
jgi:hypothetical protein